MLVYAVIETGGKQVRVKEGDTVRVERLAAAPGDEVTLNRILLIGNGKTEIGAPVVAGAMVRARVLRQGRGGKIRGMKYKPKAHYRRRTGHPQGLPRPRIRKMLGRGGGERAPDPLAGWAESQSEPGSPGLGLRRSEEFRVHR